jgi:hypothetical protein
MIQAVVENAKQAAVTILELKLEFKLLNLSISPIEDYRKLGVDGAS